MKWNRNRWLELVLQQKINGDNMLTIWITNCCAWLLSPTVPGSQPPQRSTVFLMEWWDSVSALSPTWSPDSFFCVHVLNLNITGLIMNIRINKTNSSPLFLSSSHWPGRRTDQQDPAGIRLQGSDSLRWGTGKCGLYSQWLEPEL